MTTRYVALYGDPVEGNPTAAMQNAAFTAVGIDWWYLDILVRPADLADAVGAARTLGFGGLNLTIPHKVAVIPYLDELERSAAIAGAVNTVRRAPDGRLVGLNTDGLGFLRSIVEHGFDPRGTTAVILGAGGAARAVAVELAIAGVARIAIANRSAPNRDALAALVRDRTDAHAEAIAWEGVLVPPACDLLVDCTPIGMGSGSDALAVPPVDLSALPAGRLVCDLNPERADTAFLAAARAAGHVTLGGLPMVARQGAAGFEAWTGERAPLDVMIAALEARVAAG